MGMVGWCKGAGETLMHGRPTNLDKSRARAYCAFSSCGGCLDIFSFVYLFFLSPSLGDGPI